MNKEKTIGKKNIYKRSIFEELVKRGNRFSHSMRNGRNNKFQVYVFHQDDKLIKDLIDITTKKSEDQ